MEKKKNYRTPIGDPNPDAPLSAMEEEFIKHFLRTGNALMAVKAIKGLPKQRADKYRALAKQLQERPRVQAEIDRIMEEIKKETVATADEVMQFFTAVMRGEVKDQFGLDATLSDRTRAAQEIAKRTIDIVNKQAGVPDQKIEISLDWSRDE